MRLYVDCTDDHRPRQRLASTHLLVPVRRRRRRCSPCLLAAPLITHGLFGVPATRRRCSCCCVNTFVIGFYFIPFHELRIAAIDAATFMALTITRSAATHAAAAAPGHRLRLGVIGVVLADLVVTSRSSARDAALVRAADPPGVLARRPARGAALRPAAACRTAWRSRSIAVVGPLRARRVYATLSEIGLYSIGASVRDGAEAVPERVRVRVGAVLLRDSCASRTPSRRSA